MMVMAEIFLNIIAPILLLLLLGLFLQRKFNFDLKSLSHLMTYGLMPAAIFMNIYQTDFNMQLLVEVALYLFLFTLTMMLIGIGWSRALKLERNDAAILKNGISLMNSGNYGLPVSQMLFSANPVGTSIQIIVLLFQNLMTYTYGLYNLIAATKSGWNIIKTFLKLPLIYAALLGALLNGFEVNPPSFLLTPIQYLADGFMAIALIILGAQLANIKVKSVNIAVISTCFTRLIISPAVAMGIIFLLGIDGVIAQSLLVASALPTSRNSATLALEYDVNPDVAAQTVLITTLLSGFSVSIVVYLSTIIFPY
ncbi:MAG: AEC family transporter [Cytobacillus gottheilii]|uniref:AEC family transporter n=1 Tax=Cytobacillus gottheilii TaxID=859144 RepID=UPI00082A82B2|nr:AEC family transporter [Cytobacillus gottheilii]